MIIRSTGLGPPPRGRSTAETECFLRGGGFGAAQRAPVAQARSVSRDARFVGADVLRRDRRVGFYERMSLLDPQAHGERRVFPVRLKVGGRFARH